MKLRPNVKKLKKTSVLISVILVAVFVGVIVWQLSLNRPTQKPISTASDQPLVITKVVEPVKPSNKLHVSAMGDMLAHDTIIANAKTDTGYDFTKFFKNILPSYEKSDVVFCNQEGLSAGESFGISGYPSFNAPAQFSTDLSNVKCNAINLANNHMGDKGVAAISKTIDNWAALKPLLISGANKTATDQANVGVAEVNGVKISLVSFADFNNNKSTPAANVNLYHDESLVRKLVGYARANSDLVMVSMHWGVEDSNTVSSDQTTQANLLASLGADVVIGTGPHVLQRQQTIARPDGGQIVVWYSLGNMLSSQLNINELIGGIAGFDVEKTADKQVKVTNLTFIPTYMHYEWTASERDSGNLLARKNAMIHLLDQAAEPMSRSLLNTSVSVEKQYVISTLGSGVTIK